MHAFQYTLRSLFAICILLSEYLLLFDHWIVIAPVRSFGNVTRLSRPEVQRKRYLAAVKTTLAYALSEPICYALISAISEDAIWCAAMAGYLHIPVVVGTVAIKVRALVEVKKEHEESCLSEFQYQQQAVGTQPNQTGDEENEHLFSVNAEEKPNPNLNKYDDDGNTVIATSGEASPTSNIAPCTKHKLSPLFTLATFLPIGTAALMNAGLLLYVRYLDTTKSEEWLDRFAFGWTVIALLVAFCTAVSKLMNKYVQEICRRHLLPLGVWELGQRLSCLAILVLVRASFRALLSQPAFVTVHGSNTGSGLVLNAGRAGGNTTGDPDKDGKPLDNTLKSIPPWVGLAASTINIVGWGSYWCYKLFKRYKSRNEDRGH